MIIFTFQRIEMSLSANYRKRNLKFEFVARTSRGSFREKDSYYIILKEGETIGIGEVSPLKGLSVDDVPEIENEIALTLKKMEGLNSREIFPDISEFLKHHVDDRFPSIRFGIETALMDLKNGGSLIIYPGAFEKSESGIEINGLIWMGDLEFMLTQITTKIYDGFRCIKIKIGSLDFERECDILKYVRNKYFRDKIEIRVDANGAFKPEVALEKLDILFEYDLHSIEQPIKPGQKDVMKSLCKQTPIPIVLDEELIGIHAQGEMLSLLEFIRPQYIVLKPTLLGGFIRCNQWIECAEKLEIGWWVTSALESNIGLNAICQYTDNLSVKIPQGLGTGELFTNNIPSPLEIKKSEIRLNKYKNWDVSEILKE